MQVAESGFNLPLASRGKTSGVKKGDVSGNEDEGIRWHLIVWKLWKEVSDQVRRSHGKESSFATEVAAFEMGVEEGYRDFEAQIGTERAKGVMEAEWAKFREGISGVEH